MGYTYQLRRHSCSLIGCMSGRMLSARNGSPDYMRQASGGSAARHIRKYTRLTKATGRPKQLPILCNEEPAVQFYATCHPGLEEVVARELSGPDIAAWRVAPGKAGVAFCYWLQSEFVASFSDQGWGSRVLVLLAEGNLNPRRPGGDELYRFAREAVYWPDVLEPGQTFRVDAKVASCTDVPSTLLVQARLRDAICDAMRDAGAARPAPPTKGSLVNLPLFAALHRDHVLLYRDMSGESLHRRGYRSAMHRASLNEAAAAGALLLAGWPSLATQGEGFVDPMCGSGTFLVEAALMATRVAPGLLRSASAWPFLSWPDHQPDVWRACLSVARSHQQQWHAARPLLGNDIHPAAVALARRDAEAAGVAHLIDFRCGDCASLRLSKPPSLVLVNPPWGHRLGPAREQLSHPAQEGQSRRGGGVPAAPPTTMAADEAVEEIQTSWTKLSAFLKGECAGAQAFVLCGNPAATRLLRMKKDRMYPITIGGIDTRLIKYTVLPPRQVNVEH